MKEIDPRFERQLPERPPRILPSDDQVITDFEVTPLQPEVVIDLPT